LARDQWHREQSGRDTEKLVFLDETWATTNMVRTRGRSPRGHGAIGKQVALDVFEPYPSVCLCLNLMLTSEHWIPVEGSHELPLIQTLVAQRRRFIKPLRYDAGAVAGFANAILLDVGQEPLPLHVVSPFFTDAERKTKEAAISGSAKAWVWYTDEAMPPLIPAQGKMSNT
jgi:hypothetical protein